MSSFISIFVVIAMLFSGAYYTDDPAAQSSMVTTIDNIVLTIDDQMIELNPSLVFGSSTENGAALLDFSMPCGDNTLFPVQAKLDDAGISVILGDSNTAYTFSNDMLAEMVTGDVAMLETIVADFSELMAATAAMSSLSDEQLEAYNAKVNAYVDTLLADAVTEEATFILEGEELSGESFAFTITNEQMLELMDLVYTADGGAFLEAYLGLFNDIFAMSGMEIELTSFSDIMKMAGAEFSVDVEAVGNETSAIWDLVMNVTSAIEGSEPITVSLPMTITVYDAETADIYIPIDADGMALNLYMSIDSQSVVMSLDMPSTETDASFGLTTASIINEDGSVHSEYFFTLSAPSYEESGENYSVYSPSVFASLTASETTNADMSGSGQFGLDLYVDESYVGFYMEHSTARAEIVDRIAQASNTVVFNSAEEVEENSSIMMSLMGLMGDVEKLMTDESVAQLIELFTVLSENTMTAESVAVIGGADGPTSITVGEETYEYVDEYDYESDYWSEGHDDPADLSFTVPEITWLPEGFVLDDQYVYADASDSMYLYYQNENYDMLDISFYGYDWAYSEGSASYILKDGVAAPVDGQIISLYTEEGYINANTLFGSVGVDVSFYGEGLTAEDLVAIIAGMTFN